jgi:IS30 family transposase
VLAIGSSLRAIGQALGRAPSTLSRDLARHHAPPVTYRTLPAQLRRSLTYDQGPEMREHRLCTKQTRMRVYFAHPHSLLERGTNENTNGLLRQFIPKGTRFTRLSRTESKRVQAMFNDRPRKILNWHSPAHAFHQLLR